MDVAQIGAVGALLSRARTEREVTVAIARQQHAADQMIADMLGRTTASAAAGGTLDILA